LLGRCAATGSSTPRHRRAARARAVRRATAPRSASPTRHPLRCLPLRGFGHLHPGRPAVVAGASIPARCRSSRAPSSSAPMAVARQPPAGQPVGLTPAQGLLEGLEGVHVLKLAQERSGQAGRVELARVTETRSSRPGRSNAPRDPQTSTAPHGIPSTNVPNLTRVSPRTSVKELTIKLT
jgi:hypothetical protein